MNFHFLYNLDTKEVWFKTKSFFEKTFQAYTAIILTGKISHTQSISKESDVKEKKTRTKLGTYSSSHKVDANKKIWSKKITS